ncbi:MAG: DNA polymerase III subunit beta [Gammaproteobacteria bacterium]|nr:DNA polymerase III subunit beta [Gammaproteobacteria bacterium]
MRFEIQREALLKPLQQVIGVVERRQTLPILGNIRISADGEGIALTATDLEVELVARTAFDVEEAGEITVPARKFMDICRTLPEEARIGFAVQGERAVIRSGKSRFNLLTLPAADFPTIEGIDGVAGFSVPQDALKTLIERTAFAMAQQDVRYYLNGLLLEMSSGRLRTVATDGHRLALRELGAEVDSEEARQVIVPRKGVHELSRLLEESDAQARVEVGTNHVRVTLPDICFTSKLIDGRFPDYERVIPQAGDKTLSADREILRQALVRTSILSNEKYRGVKLNLTGGALRIQAHNPEQEEAEEEIEVEYEGEPLEIGFNVTYLLDALGAVGTDHVEVEFSDPNSSCLIREAGSDAGRLVIMPMRL